MRAARFPVAILDKIAPMTKRLLILDTETSGVDPKKDHVIEVAWILYSVPDRCAITSCSSLVHAESNEAQGINGIPVSALRSAPEREYVWKEVSRLGVANADALISHNADFDRGFTPEFAVPKEKPWICSMFDVKWPKGKVGSLVQVVTDHGLGVASTHRAMADCDMISRLLTRTAELGADLDELLRLALRPKGWFKSLAPYEEGNATVKAASFRFYKPGKFWWRRMVREEALALPFRVQEMPEAPPAYQE